MIEIKISVSYPGITESEQSRLVELLKSRLVGEVSTLACTIIRDDADAPPEQRASSEYFLRSIDITSDISVVPQNDGLLPVIWQDPEVVVRAEWNPDGLFFLIVNRKVSGVEHVPLTGYTFSTGAALQYKLPHPAAGKPWLTRRSPDDFDEAAIRADERKKMLNQKP